MSVIVLLISNGSESQSRVGRIRKFFWSGVTNENVEMRVASEDKLNRGSAL